MKKMILSVALVLATFFSAIAHTITPIAYCSSSGYVTFDNTAFVIGAGNTAFFYITSDGNVKSSHNSYVWTLTVNLSVYTVDALNDSVGAIRPTGFLLDIPERFGKNPSNNVKVFASESNGSSTYAASVVSLSTLGYGCNLALPVTLTQFQAQKNSNGSVLVTWTTGTELNNKDFVLQGSIDGITWKGIATIPSYWSDGNSQTSHQYVYTIGSLNVKEASLMFGFIILFVLGLLLHITKYRMGKWIVITSVLLFGMSSCSKTNVQPATYQQYQFLRVLNVAIDGTTGSSSIIHL